MSAWIFILCDLTSSIERGETYELVNKPLGDNLILCDNFTTSPNSSVPLGRISLVWARDNRWGRRLALYEHHRRAVCRPVTLAAAIGREAIPMRSRPQAGPPAERERIQLGRQVAQ